MVDQWIKLKSNSASIEGGLGFCLICAGEYERGYTMLIDSIQLNPYYQWWFNAGLSIYHFQKNEFEEAIYWAEKIHLHSNQWELILKIASQVEMECMEEARTSLTNLKEIFTDFDFHINQYLKTFIQSDTLVDRLHAAIEKANH